MNILLERNLKKAKLFLLGSKIYREPFEAYYFRLPENIQVNWKRDGDFIVGKVIAEKNEFMTQGKSADDFVEMVNDAIYTVYGIPLEYMDAIKKARPYYPPAEIKKQLEDLSIMGNTLSIKRNNNAMQMA
ncbi:MAG TPA: hypothetical protein VF817_01645 [Patescibacteria group bacterium]